MFDSSACVALAADRGGDAVAAQAFLDCRDDLRRVENSIAQSMLLVEHYPCLNGLLAKWRLFTLPYLCHGAYSVMGCTQEARFEHRFLEKAPSLVPAATASEQLIPVVLTALRRILTPGAAGVWAGRRDGGAGGGRQI